MMTRAVKDNMHGMSARRNMLLHHVSCEIQVPYKSLNITILKNWPPARCGIEFEIARAGVQGEGYNDFYVQGPTHTSFEYPWRPLLTAT